MKFILLVLFFIFQIIKSKHEVQGNNDTNKPNRMVVETFLYIDYSVYQKWLNFKNGNREEAINDMLNFYNYAFQGVDEIFQKIETHDLNISIVLAGLYLNENATIFEGVKSELHEAKVFFNQSKHMKNLNYDVIAFVKDFDTNGINGETDLNAACTSMPLLVVKQLASPEFITLLAHEIAHTLGSDHDGEDTSIDCDKSLSYIMAQQQSYIEKHLAPNRFKFSECSLKSMKLFMQELNSKKRNCLSETHEIVKGRKTTMPGLLYSLDQQCQLLYGPLSYNCGGGSICRDLSCFNPEEKICLGNQKVSAADGSSCGDKMWCMWNLCVHDYDAPQLPGALEHCPQGDFKETFYGEELCSLVHSNPILCYQTLYSNRCCQSCKDVIIHEIENCEYGDKEDWCEEELKLHTTSCRLKRISQTCCYSCTLKNLNQEVASYEPINTETCKDRSTFCSEFRPSYCFEGTSNCCGSCSVINKFYARDSNNNTFSKSFHQKTGNFK